jgi:hypothetical protein
MSTALARRFKLQVSADNTAWIDFKGVNDLNPSISPTNQSADDYDSDGWASFEKTMQTWTVVAKALRKTDADVFDAGQELVRAAQIEWGDDARVYVRWFDRDGAPEAYSGRALVGWVPSKTGVADLDEVTVTFSGDGVLTSISNPYASAAVPVITSATPSGVAAGGQVQIKGSGFIGTVATTGVKFGATNATSWIVVSDQLIVAVVPAGTAGAANITVTNAAGVSTALPYTRGA